ncbi:hypothetical protein [Boudabousia tangfeifanii]|nr:hypothetical protein [Boudabousia tangfeifanii]
MERTVIPRNTWAKALILLAAFWLLTLLANAYSHYVDPYAKYQLYLLTFFFPLLSFGLAFWDGRQNGFHWIWFLIPIVCFTSIVFVLLNESALMFNLFMLIPAVVGSALGGWLKKRQKG